MARLNLDVLVNVKGAKELEGIAGNLSRVGAGMTTFVTAPLIAAGAAAFHFASDLEEASNKANTVYGDAVDEINKASESMTDAFSEAQFLDTAGTFGALLKNMGFTADAAADLSIEWVNLAGDMASFHNVNPEEALTAIRSALSGEFEPLKRFGVALNVATIEQRALEQGLWDGVGAVDANTRALIIQQELMKQQPDVIGDFARTADGAANSQRQLTANFQDAAATLGTTLLPIGTQLITMVNGWVKSFASLSPETQQIIIKLAALAAAAGPVLFAGGKIIGMFRGIGTAFTVLKTLMLANPYAALIAATIAIVTLIITNWDKITAMFRKALSFIKGVGERLWKPISEGFGGAIDFIRGVWNSFARWWNSIEISVPSIDIPFVGKVGGFTIGLPDLPMLAEGGIVTGPTLALIGEKSPEAVVPLDHGGVGLGTQINVTVQGDDQQTLEERIARTIDRVLWVNDLSDRVQVA